MAKKMAGMSGKSGYPKPKKGGSVIVGPCGDKKR